MRNEQLVQNSPELPICTGFALTANRRGKCGMTCYVVGHAVW
jgi:hypothetical protein